MENGVFNLSGVTEQRSQLDSNPGGLAAKPMLSATRQHCPDGHKYQLITSEFLTF